MRRCSLSPSLLLSNYYGTLLRHHYCSLSLSLSLSPSLSCFTPLLIMVYCCVGLSLALSPSLDLLWFIVASAVLSLTLSLLLHWRYRSLLVARRSSPFSNSHRSLWFIVASALSLPLSCSCSPSLSPISIIVQYSVYMLDRVYFFDLWIKKDWRQQFTLATLGWN
jgi:hypothetical protein